MSCCGNKRNAMTERTDHTQTPSANQPGVQKTFSNNENGVVHFQYTGNTALTVRSMFSQRLYRFAKPGAVLEVDKQDVPSFAAIGVLKRVAPL